MKFTDCIEIVGAKPAQYKGTKQYVSTGAVEEYFINKNSIEEYTYNERPSRADLVGKSGDILFAKMAETKKTLILNRETENYLFSTGFFVIRPKNGIITTKCLYYLLNSKNFLSQKEKNSSGTTQKAITNTGLEKINVNVPLFSKQEQIVKQFDLLTNIIKNYQRQLEKYDLLIKSRFIEMFGDNPIESGKWKVESLEGLCKIITDGTHQPPKFTTSGIPFLFVSNIAGNKITYETEKYISEQTYAELYKRTPIEIGDLLLSTVGSYGHPAIVENDKKFLFQRHIAYLKPKTDLLDSVYFHGALLSPFGQKQIEERVKGIAQKTLNLSEIRKIKIPVPPLALQQQFAQFVQQIDKSKFAVQKSLEKAETLYKSLMQKYFA